MAFDADSLAKLSTCHPDLVMIATLAEEIVHHKIVCGARTKDEQEACFAAGTSQKHYPDGKHCVGMEAGRSLSWAVDFAPKTLQEKIDWRDVAQFNYLAGVYMGIAKALGIKLRYGGDWNQNGILSDESFRDSGHVELMT